MYPKTLQTLIEELKKLPGVGTKTAERYAFSLLQQSKTDVYALAQALIDSKQNLHECEICGNISEKEQCDICLDGSRDKSIICVVQEDKDIIAIEKTQHFTGVYHVLHGVISTTKGILPNDLNIDSLIKRAQKDVKEIILAINPTVEGEMTSLYLAKRLELLNLQVTRLASGLPMGAQMDYADELTLIRALEGRKKL